MSRGMGSRCPRGCTAGESLGLASLWQVPSDGLRRAGPPFLRGTAAQPLPPAPRSGVQPRPAPTASREPLALSHRHRHLVVFVHTFPLIQDGLGLGCVQLQDTVAEGQRGPP